MNYGTSLTGRGDDIVISFDRLALQHKLILWDYFLIPFHTEPRVRFKNWVRPVEIWKEQFIGQRLKNFKEGEHLELNFTNNISLFANPKFVSIYNERDICVYESKKG